MLLSPVNPSHLVTAGEDGKVMVWDYVKGDLVYSLEVNDDGVVGHMCMAKVGDERVEEGKGQDACWYVPFHLHLRVQRARRTEGAFAIFWPG